MRFLALSLLIATASFAGPANLKACKESCKKHMKGECEKACIKGAPKPKDLEACLKVVCDVMAKGCETMCEDREKKKKK